MSSSAVYRYRPGGAGASPRRERGIPLGLTIAAFALALVQRPGLAVADTKIDLHADPAGFLTDVASVWSDSGGLGQVQAGQYAGYLFPMAPFFAGLRELGLSPWLVQRLWLGLVLAVAAWGTVRLLDELLGRPRGAAHAVAGAMVVLNPYVLVFANRTSVTLLGYALLPWMLLAVHRGLREPRGWWWPAAFALLLASTGGGVNAAVTAWLLLGPLLLLAYELRLGSVKGRDAGRFALRCAGLSVAASLWWIVPVAAHARYGLNFLPFTESPGAIWSTTSVSESFRQMGYWITYLGRGFGETLAPYFDSTGTLLFDPLPLIASFLVPGLVIAGFAWTRRLRYGPFFVVLLLAGVFVMIAGFPEDAPFRRAVTFTYNRVEAVQFLRTTYKAAPLMALAVACLGGLAVAELQRRTSGRRGAAIAAACGLCLVAATAAWPLLAGRAIDSSVAYGEVPAAWQDAARDLDRELAPATRALVLPGQISPSYTWGDTQDPVLPALSKRPVAVRTLAPYADLHAADLLYTVDDLVQQRRLVPGQLEALLELMGAGAVVTGSDDRPERSGALEPAAVEEELRRQTGLGSAARRYGSRRRFGPPAGDLAGGVALPEVRRYDIPRARRLVRVEPRSAAVVVDGSAEALAGLAAFGGLSDDGPLFYAGDATPSELRRAAREGAELVISDSNRRRVFVSSRPRQSFGATLGPDDPISRDAAVLNPFSDRGTAAQTVAMLDGARSIRAPYSPNFPQFPEHRPYAAFDGSPKTYWIADRYLALERRYLEIDFGRALDVPYVDLLPQRESRTEVAEVVVAGRRRELRPGWNRVRLGLRDARRLRVLVTRLEGPEKRFRGPGAIAEVRVPGVEVSERLRPPQLAERALAGADLSRAALVYLFARASGDRPFLRAGPPDPDRGFVPVGRNQESALVAEPGDGEREISRVLSPPAGRAFTLDGWVRVAPDASDAALDRLAGYRGDTRATSSGRWQGRPRHRASSALDGDARTAWVAPRSMGAPWIAWRTRRPVKLRSLALSQPQGPVALPALVRVHAGAATTPPLRVSAGRVSLPEAMPGRAFRLEVLRGGSASAAVGIAELRGNGLPRVRPVRRGPVLGSCGVVSAMVGGRRGRLRLQGRLEDLDAGRPLRAQGCGPALELARGPHELRTRSALFRTELLRLRSPAPAPLPAPITAGAGGRVLNLGRSAQGSYDGVRVEIDGPAWVVLGESYNRGWRAWCEGRSLGEPRVIDGFANGWPAEPGCRNLRFAFSANRTAQWSYGISAVVVLGLLALLVLRRRRPDAVAVGPGAWVPETGGGDRRLTGRRALIVAAALVPVASFLFAIRAGVVIGPLVGLALWRGVGAGALSLAAGGLVGVVLPVLALAIAPDDLGGYNSEYAIDLIAAHWVGLAAFVLLALALGRSVAGLSRASRPSGAPAGAQPDADP